ncbi:YlxR family protein [Nocardioides terrisoli]|uniref:YlxR family protein n=1 Tax=Nocardioides terrisoli TaxID=3388267 RepID=UPI00287BAA97|nr:YlxR family protein [Nocardioides marmorisolisilvae]
MRTCVGCRKRVTKRELLRVTLGADPTGRPAVVPDPSGTAPGRGAHLHPTTACLELAERRRALPRALRWSGSSALALDELWELVTLNRSSGGDARSPGQIR